MTICTCQLSTMLIEPHHIRLLLSSLSKPYRPIWLLNPINSTLCHNYHKQTLPPSTRFCQSLSKSNKLRYGNMCRLGTLPPPNLYSSKTDRHAFANWARRCFANLPETHSHVSWQPPVQKITLHRRARYTPTHTGVVGMLARYCQKRIVATLSALFSWTAAIV